MYKRIKCIFKGHDHRTTSTGACVMQTRFGEISADVAIQRCVRCNDERVLLSPKQLIPVATMTTQYSPAYVRGEITMTPVKEDNE